MARNLTRWVIAWALAAVCVWPAWAAEHEDERPEVLAVTGHGEVRLPADRATVRFGAVAEAEEAAAAQQRVNEIMAEAIEEIIDLDIPEQRLQTSNLSLQPIHERNKSYSGNGPKIIGYRASYTLSVDVQDIEQVGAVIDAGLESGINQFQGVEFGLHDDGEARRDALRAAAQDAQAKADAIAEALGIELDGIARVTEGGGQPGPPRPMGMGRGMMAAEATSTPVQAGEITISADLLVEYAIED